MAKNAVFTEKKGKKYATPCILKCCVTQISQIIRQTSDIFSLTFTWPDFVDIRLLRHNE